MDEHHQAAWNADLEVLFGDHTRTMSTPRLLAQRVGEIYCDALVKQGYLDTRLSYRELFWFPVCAGFCGGVDTGAAGSGNNIERVADHTRPFGRVLGSIVHFGACRWDGLGGGTPAGDEIPLVARLAAVVATYVASMPDQPVIADHLAALDLVCARAGHELDPLLVELFVTQSGVLGQHLCAPASAWPSDAACSARLVTM